MKRKRELLKPHTHCFPEAPRVGFMLKAHNDVIREPQDNDVACSFIPSPPLGPEIEDVVQVPSLTLDRLKPATKRHSLPSACAKVVLRDTGQIARPSPINLLRCAVRSCRCRDRTQGARARGEPLPAAAPDPRVAASCPARSAGTCRAVAGLPW